MAEPEQARLVAQIRAWCHEDPIRRSRFAWLLSMDERRDPPWPYGGLWFDRGGAALADLSPHPEYGTHLDNRLPWFQAAGEEWLPLLRLLDQRLPAECEVLADEVAREVLESLGTVEPTGSLSVRACAPGELTGHARPVPAVRLTSADRALVAADDWRPEDLDRETDEHQDGVRWAIIERRQIICRLIVQPISEGLAEISDVHTHPDHRRQGLGAGLVAHVLRRLHDEGWTATYSVHPSNFASICLASSLGFTERFIWERYWLRREVDGGDE
ncbi:MAG TPA: hypothetical protein DCZ72_00200 [Armatimonadetes bacterium]|nr:hypothetical protein [Armatimonadota bacterium]